MGRWKGVRGVKSLMKTVLHGEASALTYLPLSWMPACTVLLPPEPALLKGAWSPILTHKTEALPIQSELRSSEQSELLYSDQSRRCLWTNQIVKIGHRHLQEDRPIRNQGWDVCLYKPALLYLSECTFHTRPKVVCPNWSWNTEDVSLGQTPGEQGLQRGAAAPHSCSTAVLFHSHVVLPLSRLHKVSFLLHHTPNRGFLLAFELVPITIGWQPAQRNHLEIYQRASVVKLANAQLVCKKNSAM